MTIRENVPLSTLTTFKVGGNARYVLWCASDEDIKEAVAFAKEKALPYRALGQGSNLLALDSGYAGVLIHMGIDALSFSEEGTVVAGGGVAWDALVTEAVTRGYWGIENLAGIPGTVGAAPVQNIGAYGSEVKDTIVYVDAYNAESGEIVRLTNEACQFGYRESLFKRERHYIILRVAFKLATDGEPHIAYKDLRALSEKGVPLTTPEEIASAVRSVRAAKFPDLTEYGTAGSFFKNPFITEAQYASLTKRYPELPGFPVPEGVKIPIAWILDHALKLRGYTVGNVSLYERHSLVLVTKKDATATEVDAFAHAITKKVFDETGIVVEREVQTLS